MAKKNQDTRKQIQFVSFFLDEEEYGLNIVHIREFLRVPVITRVPKTPPFVLGVINLRGKVISVIDLRLRMGMSPSTITEKSRIIIINVNGKLKGILVDRVTRVFRIPEEEVEPAPPILKGASAEFVQGVGKVDGNMVIMIDIIKTLTPRNSMTLIGTEARGNE